MRSALRNLHLRGSESALRLPVQDLQLLLSRLHNLRSLQLARLSIEYQTPYSYGTATADLQDILNCIPPSLCQLALHNVIFSEPGGLPNFNAIFEARIFHRSLAASPRAHILTEATVCHEDWSKLPEFDAFLTAIGANLRHLVVELSIPLRRDQGKCLHENATISNV